MRNETFERLRDLLARDFSADPSTIRIDTPLDQLGIDSLGVTELLFSLEDLFDIRVPHEAVPLASVGDVVDYIDRLSDKLRLPDAQPAASGEAAVTGPG